MSKSSGSSGYSAFCREYQKNEEKKGRKTASLKEIMADDDMFSEWRSKTEDVKDYYRLLGRCDEHHSKADDRRHRKKSTSCESVRSYCESVRSYSSSSSRQPEPRPRGMPKRGPNTATSSSCKPSQPQPPLPHLTRRFNGTMHEYMSMLMRAKKQHNCVQNLNFYIVHANYFYVREMDNGNSDFYPVELAIAECSLEYGVQRVHHVIVKEEIYMGYRNDALTRSQESHKMPIDLNFDFKVEVQTDYAEIYEGICRFLEPGRVDGELPPLFTIRTNDDHIWRPARSILGRLAVADFKHPEHLLLYSYEELFAYIWNAVLREKNEFDIAQAIEKIEKDPNAHRNGLGCEYHKHVSDEGELHCSSSFVKRWWYRLCEFCCEPLGIEKIPDAHGPADAEPQTLVFTKLNLKPKGFGSREPRDPRRDRKRYYN